MSSLDRIAEVRAKTKVADDIGALAQTMMQYTARIGEITDRLEEREKRVAQSALSAIESLQRSNKFVDESATNLAKLSKLLTLKFCLIVALVIIVVSATSITAWSLTSRHRTLSSEHRALIKWYEREAPPTFIHQIQSRVAK